MNSREFFFLINVVVGLAESEVCIRHKIGDGTIWVQSGTNLYSLSNGIITNEVVITETCGAREVSINEDIYKTYDSATYMQTLCSELMGKASVYGTAREIQSLTFDSVAACAAYALNNVDSKTRGLQRKANGTCIMYSSDDNSNEVADRAGICYFRPIKIFQNDNVNFSESGMSYDADDLYECYNKVYRATTYNFAAYNEGGSCYGLMLDESNFTYRTSEVSTNNAPAIYYILRSSPGTCDTDSCANGSCSITLTGHRCSCDAGYTTNEDAALCVDINECDNDPCTNAMCTNTDGSYTCTCNKGYKLKEGSDQECVDIDECTDGSSSCVNGECQNTEGSYTCTCNGGYKLKEGSDRECVDINECSEGLYNCTDNSDCVNIAGSYKCECQEGYSLTDEQCLIKSDLCGASQRLVGAVVGITAACFVGATAVAGGVYWLVRRQSKRKKFVLTPNFF